MHLTITDTIERVDAEELESRAADLAHHLAQATVGAIAIVRLTC